MNQFSKIILASVLFLLLVTVTALAANVDQLYDLAFGRKTMQEVLLSEGLETPEKLQRYNRYVEALGENQQWLTKQKAEEVYIESKDGLKLHAYYLKGKSNPTKTVIVAHGYRASSIEMVSYAEYFRDHYGFNVLLPDARGHGKSEGEYVGMGWPDRLDYLQWVQWTLKKNGDSSELILFGASMGGATMMMLSGEKLPSQVKFIVEDCGFSSVEAILTYQIKNRTDFPVELLLGSLKTYVQVKLGYSLEEASSIEQVRKKTVPMIFIHGDADSIVPVSMVYQVYEAAPEPKSLLIVPGAEHVRAFNDEKARSLVDGYIKKYLTP